MRLIDADELKTWFGEKNIYGIDYIYGIIDDMFTIEPEHKKGKWILHPDDLFPEESTMECDQCHEHQPFTCDDNFCPNCGADMREGEEE